MKGERGGTLRQHVEAGRVAMDLSWFQEASGAPRWTLLDDGEGHRGFDSERAALAEYDARVARRHAAREELRSATTADESAWLVSRRKQEPACEPLAPTIGRLTTERIRDGHCQVFGPCLTPRGGTISPREPPPSFTQRGGMWRWNRR